MLLLVIRPDCNSCTEAQGPHAKGKSDQRSISLQFSFMGYQRRCEDTGGPGFSYFRRNLLAQSHHTTSPATQHDTSIKPALVPIAVFTDVQELRLICSIKFWIGIASVCLYARGYSREASLIAPRCIPSPTGASGQRGGTHACKHGRSSGKSIMAYLINIYRFWTRAVPK